MTCLKSTRNLSLITAGLTLAASLPSFGQIRTYDVPFNGSAAVTADGVISAGEWDGAGVVSGNFGVLRQAASAMDTDNNRFQMMWDNTNLYILFQSDYDNGFLPPFNDITHPNYRGGDDNVNFYFDPNTDGGPNIDSAPDGYQLAFNQYEGTRISTDADRQGVGIFTEAHEDTNFGDQGDWDEGAPGVQGAALGPIVIGQTNSNTTNTALAELVIPWVAFDADLDNTHGLNVTQAPTPGDEWFFNLGVITNDQSNFLPVWDWNSSQFFAVRSEGHGVLTFLGGNDPADLDGDGDVDDADFGIAFAAFTGPNNGPSSNPAADLDGDGDVDDADFGIAFAAFTGPGGTSVPEPASLVLLGLGGLAIARRRRA